jgi:hypothetical protein
MTQISGVLTAMQRALLPLVFAAVALAPAAGAFASVQTPRPPALPDFQARLNDYLKLRQDLAKKLRPLAPTASSAELAARQESLAAAIRTVRKGARQGDLIPPAAASLIAAMVREDFHLRNPQVSRAVFEEVPNAPRPVINRQYPQNEALPTMPPLLLNKLPLLPDNLQYRFFGRNVVILDGDTELIIDYIPNVLPPH